MSLHASNQWRFAFWQKPRSLRCPAVLNTAFSRFQPVMRGCCGLVAARLSRALSLATPRLLNLVSAADKLPWLALSDTPVRRHTAEHVESPRQHFLKVSGV